MRRLSCLLILLAGLLAAGPGFAQPAEPSPEQLRTLAQLLRDPNMQAWLQAQADRPTAAAEAPAAQSPPASAQAMMVSHLDSMRAFLRALVAAVPTLPDELHGAWATFEAERAAWGGQRPIVLIAVFVALGFGLEWLARRATTGFRQRIIASPLETAGERLRAIATRATYALLVLLTFAIGSIGGFLLFDWPPLLKQIVLGYLLVFLIVRLVLVLGRFLLAPGAERFRLVPMATATARFWFVWSAVLVGWFFFVRLTLDGLAVLGVSRAAGYLVGLACGVVLVGLALYVVWRHPARDTGVPASRTHRLGAWLLSLYLVVVWLLLFTGSPTPFYVGVVVLLLPIAIRGRRSGGQPRAAPGRRCDRRRQSPRWPRSRSSGDCGRCC